MKSPSLQSLYSSFIYVLKRFPLEFFFALLGVIAASIHVEIRGIDEETSGWCIRLIMTGVLGLVLSLSATLISESRNFTSGRKYLLGLFAVLAAFVFFFLLDPMNRETDYFRFVLLAAAFHLLVAFAAFIGKDHINAFWQFNRYLFLRFLTGALYSAVLYLGLSATIGSMNLLFNFGFEWDTFAILWIWIAGLFQTVFFLSGVPEDVHILEGDKSYPKGLKVFTQYVLIPLASVYVVILLAYEIKILIVQELPKGLVSTLILAYAVFGILSLLLIYPVRNLPENKWFKTYSKSFYFLLIPLILLLVWAVAVRVIDYGVTEERYFLIVLAIWLTFITAYFLLSKQQDIRVIPVSLAIIIMLSVFGPQGAFSISRNSQLKELETLFNKYDALRNNELHAITKPVDSADRERLVSVINYLVDKHGVKSLQAVSAVKVEGIEKYYRAKEKRDSLNMKYTSYQMRQDIKDSVVRAYNIPVLSRDYGLENKRLIRFRSEQEEVTDISGFRTLVSFTSNRASMPENQDVISVPGRPYRVRLFDDRVVVSEGSNSVSFDLNEIMERNILGVKTKQQTNKGEFLVIKEKEMSIEKRLGEIKIRLSLKGIEGGYRNPQNKHPYIVYYEGILLMQ